ncbi:hypothetical protein Cfor_07724 [Coptotermes formosanus]|uniref:VWFA domain-containing protein n=1 Tax=Coptotermes formosanus TaxID=36987 RepID=A0A6L2PPG2_COPFO|nr:hypothetical protein Cfor_07724 [Coptotermes formosanus]
MNPQYLPQQPQQQYGSPAGPGFGPSPSGFPPVPHGGLRPSPSGTPGGFQLPSGPPAPGGIHSVGPPGPQRMGPTPQGPPPFNSDLPQPGGPMPLGPGMSGAPRSASHHPGFSGSNITNGPPVSSTGPGSQPALPRGPHIMPQQLPVTGPPPTSTPNQLATQLLEMNISGQHRRPLPPAQYMNGSMGPPPGPGRGPVGGPSQPLPPQLGNVPGGQAHMPSSLGMPPQPGGMPPSDTYHPNAGAPPQMHQPPMGPQSPVSSYPSPHQPMGPPQPAHPGLQSQPARRLDPDHMPSPIPVVQDDQRNRSGIFFTNQKGLVPPLVTTNFITQDQGNASPRYIRSSMYNVPATIDMMKQTAVPFAIVVSPLARALDEEYLPPIVNMGEIGPVRCNRCKAYMCPYMQFIDGGRRFHCLFCKATTEVPPEYFQHLDHTGQRVDRFERPELMLGAYEFVATKDYCRNNTFPRPPALIFLIDVSYNNIKSGMVHLLCGQMKTILKLLPKDEGAEKSDMRVGFITYNNTVHFYNIKGCLAQPQMMVVGDVQDMFMPLLEGFLCDPMESEAVIDSLMEQIPAMFADTRETETVLAPAIQAGLEALKASECAGKLLVFHSSLPIAEAPGKLKNRDDRKLLGTEKERTVLVPQVTVYNTLGQDCVSAGCSVDLFVFNNSYIDLATIGQVSRLSGGEIYKYTYFQADLDGERLIADIKHDVSRPVAFDAIMRVRTSTGVRATDFYGHFFMSNTTDMELASIDCDKAVAIEIKHDDKLTEEDGVYIQVALLYTSCGGQRRLRILNLSLKTCTQMADLYRSCELDTIVNFFSKQAVFRLLESSPKSVKDNLVNRCAQMLACYRKNCASPSSAGQLILPECMKLLPLYANCILKSDAVSGGSDMTIDDRLFVMQAVTVMDIPSSVVYFYPRLVPLHEIDVDSSEDPPAIRCTSDKIRDDGVYLLENGIHLFLWIGLNVSMEWVQNVFGVHSAAQIDIDRTSLPQIDNPLSVRVRSVIESVRHKRHRFMRVNVHFFPLQL